MSWNNIDWSNNPEALEQFEDYIQAMAKMPKSRAPLTKNWRACSRYVHYFQTCGHFTTLTDHNPKCNPLKDGGMCQKPIYDLQYNNKLCEFCNPITRTYTAIGDLMRSDEPFNTFPIPNEHKKSRAATVLDYLKDNSPEGLEKRELLWRTIENEYCRSVEERRSFVVSRRMTIDERLLSSQPSKKAREQQKRAFGLRDADWRSSVYAIAEETRRKEQYRREAKELDRDRRDREDTELRLANHRNRRERLRQHWEHERVIAMGQEIRNKVPEKKRTMIPESWDFLQPVEPSPGDICAICLDQMVAGQDIRQLPCEYHRYHYDCISRHFIKAGHDFCPLCKEKYNVARMPNWSGYDEQNEWKSSNAASLDDDVDSHWEWDFSGYDHPDHPEHAEPDDESEDETDDGSEDESDDEAGDEDEDIDMDVDME